MINTLRAALIACALLAFGAASAAETGFYIGGNVGNAGVELDFADEGFDLPDFDEDDFAWKVFGGYNFGLAGPIDLGIEGGYVDFGAPSGTVLDVPVEIDPTGWNIFGVGGFELGPVGVFAKLGYVAWDIEAAVADVNVGSDDGSDLAWGVGARFNLASIEVRGEYESYDIEDADRVDMISVGIAFYFD